MREPDEDERCDAIDERSRRGMVVAVLASGAAGAVVDSAAFLWFAFGSLDYLSGQVVGKMWAVLASWPLIVGARKVVRHDTR